MATPSLGFDNFYTSTLSAGITASDTTIYLNALPTATEGYIVIEPDSSTQREIIYYTSKGANFVTLPSAAAGRGVGATTAQSHSSGVTAQMNVVAEHFEALQDGTAISNTAITAAKIANIATNTTAISNPYKFSVYRNAAANTGNNAFAKVTFDTEVFDTNSNFATGTYTAPVAGFYQLSSFIEITPTADQIQVAVEVYKNGASHKRFGVEASSGTGGIGSGGSVLVQSAASDTWEIYVYATSTKAIAVAATSAWFTGFLVSQT